MKQKVALVTGASSGIGTAVVSSLQDCDYLVIGAGWDAQRTAKLAEFSQNVKTWTGEIDSPQACASLVAHCFSQLGGIDLLVNNAGIYSQVGNTSIDIGG